jgi:hypothetical protein
MMFHQTMEKLYGLRLTGMAIAWQDQVKTPDICELSFDERLGLLVDRE